jgi:hypothetical protein
MRAMVLPAVTSAKRLAEAARYRSLDRNYQS